MSAVQTQPVRSERDAIGIALRVAIVALALASAWVHTTLGSLLFLGTALGYVVLAAAMVVPIPIIARYRWLVRAALVVFTTGAVLGWVMFGARFMLAYIDKAMEIGLIALLLIEMWRYDGGPLNVLRRSVQLAITILRLPFAKRSDA